MIIDGNIRQYFGVNSRLNDVGKWSFPVVSNGFPQGCFFSRATDKRTHMLGCFQNIVRQSQSLWRRFGSNNFKHMIIRAHEVI